MHKQNSQAFKSIVFGIGIYIFLGGQGHAYEGWNLQLEPMYMGVAGADNHQANITTTNYTFSAFTFIPALAVGIISPTSSTTTSQNFDMGGNATFRGQLEYMPEDWGVGVSGWWFNTSDSMSQNFNSAPWPSLTQDSAYTTVDYRSNNFSLSAPPSGSGSVLITSANSSLGVWNVDAYGIKTLGEFQNVRINMTLGAKFGSIDSDASEWVNGGSSSINSGSEFIFSGYPTSQQNGNAVNSADASFLVGPSIGVQGHGKYGNNRLEGFLSQSVLIGNVNRKTTIINQYSDSYLPYSYNFSTSLLDSETVAIPVTEMKIKYLYDFTEHLSLGLGFFGSAWINTPTTPTAQFNDRQYKTLFFYGGLASINLRY